MIQEKDIIEAKETIIKYWGEEGEKVIAECAKCEPLNMTLEQFLQHCFAWGGDWLKMFLSGIKELRPTVWDAIPEDLGKVAFGCICSTIVLCGVDTKK